MRQPVYIPENLVFNDVKIRYTIRLSDTMPDQRLMPIGYMALRFMDDDITYDIFELTKKPIDRIHQHLFIDARMYPYLRNLQGRTYDIDGFIKCYTDQGKFKHGVFRIRNTQLLVDIASMHMFR